MHRRPRHLTTTLSLPNGILLGMPSTTIKVDSGLRDRFASLARARGLTMGGLLADVVERMERETFFATAHDQLQRLRTNDPEEWGRDRAESSTWQQGTDRESAATRDDAGWWE